MTPQLIEAPDTDFVALQGLQERSCLPSGNMRVLKPRVKPSGTDLDYWSAFGKGSVMCAIVLNTGAVPIQPIPFDAGLLGSQTVTVAPTPVLRREEDADVAAGVTREAGSVVATNATPDILLSEIQAAFMLPASDLAEILDVSRTTVYQYINGETTTPNERTQERLRQLHHLSREWWGLTDAPMGRLWSLAISDDVPSLVTQLRSSDWDKEQISGTLRALAEMVDERAAHLREARARGFGRGRSSSPEDREVRHVDEALLRNG